MNDNDLKNLILQTLGMKSTPDDWTDETDDLVQKINFIYEGQIKKALSLARWSFANEFSLLSHFVKGVVNEVDRGVDNDDILPQLKVTISNHTINPLDITNAGKLTSIDNVELIIEQSQDFNVTVNIGSYDNDGIDLELSSKTQGEIVDLYGNRGLQIFTAEAVAVNGIISGLQYYNKVRVYDNQKDYGTFEVIDGVIDLQDNTINQKLNIEIDIDCRMVSNDSINKIVIE